MNNAAYASIASRLRTLEEENVKLLAAAKHFSVCDYPDSVDFRCKDCQAGYAAIEKAERRTRAKQDR